MNKEDYVWYKSRGLCTHCRKEKAVDGKTLCLECLILNRSYKKKPVDKEVQRERDKAKRAYRKEQGLCVNCGCRPQKHGLLCNKCYRTVQLRKIKRNAGKIPRTERVSFGLCYICGAEKLSDRGVCQSCYEKRLEAISKASTMTKWDKNAFNENHQQTEVIVNE